MINKIICFLSLTVFSAIVQVANAGEIVLQGNYVNPKCTFELVLQNAFKVLSCNGVRVLQIVIQPINPEWTPGQVLYFDDKNFDSVTSNNIETISYKSPFSDLLLDSSLGGTFKIYSADRVFDKPVILVEGYDPENKLNPDDYYGRFGFSTLVYEGRDLIVVNFPNGSESLNSNATLLQRIIQEVNGRKTGTHPTAVIGYSMGGIIAKKALKNMENSGTNHQTSLYVSYDSPHMGANSPQSLQDAVEGIINNLDSHLFGYTPTDLKIARNYYNSPAAREMLIAAPSFVPASASSFPARLARVAVTAGSLDSIKQTPAFSLGETVAAFKVTFIKNVFMSYSADVQLSTKLRGNVYYDVIPGSYMYQFDDAMTQFSKTKIQIRQALNPGRPITFVPTTSALAIVGDPTVRAFDSFKYKSPFDKYIAIDSSYNSACAKYAAQASLGANSKHDIFPPVLLEQLKCALNEFHRIGAAIPDRSFKTAQ